MDRPGDGESEWRRLKLSNPRRKTRRGIEERSLHSISIPREDKRRYKNRKYYSWSEDPDVGKKSPESLE